jgi:hypothetical protein
MTLTGRIVVKERIQAHTITDNVVRVNDAKTPCASAVAALTSTRTGKVWVVESTVNGPWCRSLGVGLIVSNNGKFLILHARPGGTYGVSVWRNPKKIFFVFAS